MRTAKRRAWLEDEEGEGYHDTTELVSQLRDALLLLHAELGGAVTYVFGELHGGSGEDAVQKEIVYCSRLSFLCFDLVVDGVFVDYCRVLQACGRAGMPCLRPLFSGTLAKCLAFDVDFVSTVPALHGEKAVSRAEGVVVKCSVELVVRDAKGASLRAVTKIKSARFKEVLAGYKATKGREKEALASAYVTRARLGNLLSKCGKIRSRKDTKLVARLCREMQEDILQEARQGDALLAQYLETHEQEAVEAIAPRIALLVEQWASEA